MTRFRLAQFLRFGEITLVTESRHLGVDIWDSGVPISEKKWEDQMKFVSRRRKFPCPQSKLFLKLYDVYFS